jgi:hypothetical protein
MALLPRRGRWLIAIEDGLNNSIHYELDVTGKRVAQRVEHIPAEPRRPSYTAADSAARGRCEPRPSGQHNAALCTRLECFEMPQPDDFPKLEDIPIRRPHNVGVFVGCPEI